MMLSVVPRPVDRSVLARIAEADRLDDTARALIRTAVTAHVQELQHQLNCVLGALAAKDPEFGLAAYLDVLRELPAETERLEADLSPLSEPPPVNEPADAAEPRVVLTAG